MRILGYEDTLTEPLQLEQVSYETQTQTKGASGFG